MFVYFLVGMFVFTRVFTCICTRIFHKMVPNEVRQAAVTVVTVAVVVEVVGVWRVYSIVVKVFVGKF